PRTLPSFPTRRSSDLFRAGEYCCVVRCGVRARRRRKPPARRTKFHRDRRLTSLAAGPLLDRIAKDQVNTKLFTLIIVAGAGDREDRKSTRLNSSHRTI